MANIAPNHPAVKAALTATQTAYGENHADALEYHATALTAALTYLTAADLRNTPAGLALKAEAWDQGWRDRRQYDQDIDWRTIPVTDTNPYLEGDPGHDDEEV